MKKNKTKRKKFLRQRKGEVIENTGVAFNVLRVCPIDNCKRQLWSNTKQIYCLKHGVLAKYKYNEAEIGWAGGSWEKGGEG